MKCTVFSCFHTTGCEAYSVMTDGYRIFNMHTKGGVRHKQVCTRVDPEGYRKLSCTMPNLGMKPRVYLNSGVLSNHWAMCFCGMYSFVHFDCSYSFLSILLLYNSTLHPPPMLFCLELPHRKENSADKYPILLLLNKRQNANLRSYHQNL